MKALILAAGYATRLYPLTLDKPKSLLKIGQRPIIDHILDRLTIIGEIDEIYVVSNQKFFSQFKEWQASLNSLLTTVKLINDRSTSLEDKLGAIGDIGFAIKEKNIDDDLIVIASDNLFDFDLRQFIDFAKKKIPYHSICLYLAQNRIDLSRFGIVQLNEDFQIIGFEEKTEYPNSNLIATCIYFLPKERLHLISEYLSSGNHNDTPGFYIRWLVQNDKVFGKICDGIWYDLGDFDSLSQTVLNLNETLPTA